MPKNVEEEESRLKLAAQASLQTKHSALLNEQNNNADNYSQRIAVNPDVLV